jgi:hypothetical protein
MVPKPVYAVLMLFPISKEYEAARAAEHARIVDQAGGAVKSDERLIFIKLGSPPVQPLFVRILTYLAGMDVKTDDQQCLWYDRPAPCISQQFRDPDQSVFLICSDR